MKNTKIPLFICLIIGILSINTGFAQRSGFRSFTDDFSKVEMKEFGCNSISKEWNSPIFDAQFYFLNDSKNITLYAGFQRKISSFFPDHELFLMIDDEVIKLPIKSFENEISKYPSTIFNEVKVDSVKTNTFTTTTYIDLNYVKFKMILPVDIQLKIFNASSMSLRIYSGGQPNTFKINDVRKLKKVLE